MRGISSSANEVLVGQGAERRHQGLALAQQREFVGAFRRRHRPLDLEHDVTGGECRRSVRHNRCTGVGVGLIGIGSGSARPRLYRDLRAQRFQFLDGFGSSRHAGFVRPAFFDDGDLHDLFRSLGRSVGTRKTYLAAHHAQRSALCQAGFSPRDEAAV